MEKYAKPPEADMIVALLIGVAAIIWLMGGIGTMSSRRKGQAHDRMPRESGQDGVLDRGEFQARQTSRMALSPPAQGPNTAIMITAT
jgi:hypothetical protein